MHHSVHQRQTHLPRQKFRHGESPYPKNEQRRRKIHYCIQGHTKFGATFSGRLLNFEHTLYALRGKFRSVDLRYFEAGNALSNREMFSTPQYEGE